MNRKKNYGLVAMLMFGSLAICGAGTAGTIDSWNTDTVVTDLPPYIPYETYYSTLFTDTSLTVTNGVVAWKETDVQSPGLKVVNGDDVNGTNCIMTTGINPEDGSDKMCSDPLQSSKRFKLKNTVNDSVDLQFNVIDGPMSVYRSLQKLTDATDARWTGFTVELGFTINGIFTPSTTDDGLGFSDTRGRIFTSPVTSYQSKEDVLSAYFAQGLAGPADKYHPDPGYFNPVERMGFGLIATEDIIYSDGITATYSDIFGQWLYSGGVPIAILWDDDGNILTDNTLMANCADTTDINKAGTHSGDDVTGLACNGPWVTYRSEAGLDVNGLPHESDGVAQEIALSDLAPTVYTSADQAVASGDPAPFYMDYIEDLANLGLNFWITVDDNNQWPTPGSFTVRYTPEPVASPPVPEVEMCTDGVDNDHDGFIDCDDSDCTTDPVCDVIPPQSEVCDDGMDNDGDGAIDCADSDCSGIGFCGAEGKFNTCSDGVDNDGDNFIDCLDSGCAKNKSCR